MTPIDRATYLKWGFGLAALKYAGDVLIVWFMAGRFWSPLDYLTAISLVNPRPFRPDVFITLAVWALPFVWAGVTFSMRRAADARESPWLAFFFFVPYLNYALIAFLAAMPSGPAWAPSFEEREPPDDDPVRYAPYVAAVTAGVVSGVFVFLMSVYVLRTYSAALFFGTPVLMGAITSFVLNRRTDASDGQIFAAIFLMILTSAGLLVLFAIEGIICILMAAPIGFAGALIGAGVGKVGARFRTGLSGALIPLVALPLAGGIEGSAAPPVIEVQSSIEIAAPPEAVWPHVIAFPPLEEPRELLFRAGIAYPMRARIEGEGVGAVRYCEFSTGPFIEPITAWEPGRRLSFDVTSSPDPLRELTPYGRMSPPHLEGYMKSVKGEFRLVPLPGGRTRLEGSTWYVLEMGPHAYWRLWSDAIVHRIHMRVLTHIQSRVEGRGQRAEEEIGKRE